MPCPELQDRLENPSLTLRNVGYNVEIRCLYPGKLVFVLFQHLPYIV